mmetsp:Transcript_8440/g.31117  ORF Transcript_8440/g.31117 Transcript_8440/m.31117 type:complete len:621 (-) Transcript_8440:2985-4847(-)|eukprot:scaffold1522_cov340-Prasinococcus_capsulatus_cf.AAC.11
MLEHLAGRTSAGQSRVVCPPQQSSVVVCSRKTGGRLRVRSARKYLPHIDGRRRSGFGYERPSIQFSASNVATRSSGSDDFGGDSSSQVTTVPDPSTGPAPGIAGSKRKLKLAEEPFTAAYDEEEEVHTQGSVLGAIALVVGSSVGGGILALPVETAPAGFWPSASLLMGSYVFLSLEALLIAEVNIACMKEKEQFPDRYASQPGHVISFKEMAERTLGKGASRFVSMIYLALSYTLLVAYIAKSGDILSLPTGLSPTLSGALFTIGLSGLLVSGGTKLADILNRYLTLGLLVSFMGVLLGGATMADFHSLSFSNWDSVGGSLPVVVLALVFHDLVPILANYLGGDIKRVRKSILVGSFIPLLMFLSWEAVALSVSPSGSSVDPLEVLLTLGPTASIVIQIFSLLATTTSFVGTSLGLSEFIISEFSSILMRLLEAAPTEEEIANAAADESARLATGEGDSEEGNPFVEQLLSKELINSILDHPWHSIGIRAVSFSFAVMPPLLLVGGSDPRIFFTALEVAGAYFNSTLYGFLPVAMACSVWSFNSAVKETPEQEALLEQGALARKRNPKIRKVASGVTCQLQEWMAQSSIFMPHQGQVIVGMGGLSLVLVATKIINDLQQ